MKYESTRVLLSLKKVPKDRFIAQNLLVKGKKESNLNSLKVSLFLESKKPEFTAKPDFKLLSTLLKKIPDRMDVFKDSEHNLMED